MAIPKKPERQISLTQAKEASDRDCIMLWRPNLALPEDEQYAVIVFDPEKGE